MAVEDVELSGPEGVEQVPVRLQFGRTSPNLTVGVNEYSLDFSYPLSPIQAFGAALGLCKRKWAC